MSDKRGRGRQVEWVPSDWTEQVVDHICAGGSLISFGDSGKGPSVRTLYRWKDDDEAFAAEVQRAYRIKAQRLMDEAMEIADHTADDTAVKQTKGGGEIQVPDHEWMARSKLRVDHRVRVAAILDREMSQRHQVEHSGGVNINVATGVPEDGSAQDG